MGRDHWYRLTGLLCLLGWCAGQGRKGKSCRDGPPSLCPSSSRCPSLHEPLFPTSICPVSTSAQFSFSDQLSGLKPSFETQFHTHPMTFHPLSHHQISSGSPFTPTRGSECLVPCFEPSPVSLWSACGCVPPHPISSLPQSQSVLGRAHLLCSSSAVVKEPAPPAEFSPCLHKDTGQKPGLSPSWWRQAVDKINHLYSMSDSDQPFEEK